MRILHFAKYAFVRTGGIERHVEGLTRALAARGMDVTVLAYDPSGTEVPRWIDGVRVEPVRTLAHVSSQSLAPSLVGRAWQLARAKPFDVVHQHWPDPFAHLASSFVPGRPARVVTWHTDIVRQRVIGPLYRAVAKRLLPAPDAVICSTQAHLKSVQIEQFAPAKRRHVIPFGIDVAQYEPTAELQREAELVRKRYGGGPIVFALGRHVYYKGFDVLIRAMERVPGILLLGGEGPLTPELVRLASIIGPRVQLVGRIPDAQLPAYFHACDVFCLPSVAQTETFGLVQAEAMACAKPVVNTELRNGVNELAPHGVCALTAPPGDSAALAQVIRRVLADPNEAAALGSAGRKRVHDYFTLDVMAERIGALYEAVSSWRRRTP